MADNIYCKLKRWEVDRVEGQEKIKNNLRAIKAMLVMLSETKGEICDMDCLYNLMQDIIDECIESLD